MENIKNLENLINQEDISQNFCKEIYKVLKSINQPIIVQIKNKSNELIPNDKLIQKPISIPIPKPDFDLYKKGICQTCKENKDLLIFSQECQHAYNCYQCFQNSIKQYFSINQLCIQCENQNCSQELDFKTDFNNNLLNEENNNKREEILFNQSFYKCQNKNCNVENYITEEDEEQGNYVICECGNKICTTCKKNYDKENHVCIKFDKEAFLRIINSKTEERIRICPQCYHIYKKDDQCEKVKCMNCKLEFCFLCLCDMYPVYKHNEWYHRVDCKYHKPSDISLQVAKKDCQKCNNNQLCERPKLTYLKLIEKLQKDLGLEDIDLEQECTLPRSTTKNKKY